MTGEIEPRAGRPDGWIDHDEIGVAEILFAVAAEVKCCKGNVAQQRQGIGQGVLIGQIGDGNTGPLRGQPSRGGNSAAKMPQPHNRRPKAMIVHGYK